MKLKILLRGVEECSRLASTVVAGLASSRARVLGPLLV
jgi:hypothetical protein